MRVAMPETYAEAAALLRESTSVRIRGGGTKPWGAEVADGDVVLSTERLARVVEHNAGDLTAVLQAGVRLADAQAAFAAAGQMLALDPPLGAPEAATVGGVVATADSGPLRHRYGAPRDLLLGVTAALSDGSVAKAGGKVIKNVAGYDLAKLFAGSFGTLGAIVEVVVRLHPLPARTATAIAATDDPAALARGALAVAREPFELEALDVTWRDGRGSLVARVGGASAEPRAARVLEAMRAASLEPSNGLFLGDEGAREWDAVRARQRSADSVVVRVSGLPTGLERAVRLCDRLGLSLVGRAALGTLWLTLPADSPQRIAAAVDELRRQLAPAPCVVLDAPADVRERVDVWGLTDEPLLRLSRRVKERFDAKRACNPGVFVGGI